MVQDWVTAISGLIGPGVNLVFRVEMGSGFYKDGNG